MPDQPVIGVIMGDPCGIRPEVLVKAVVDPSAERPSAHLFAIGSASAMQQAARAHGNGLRVRQVERAEDLGFQGGHLDVLDPGTLDVTQIRFGQVSTACGRAVVEWRALGALAVAQGHAHALVQGGLIGLASSYYWTVTLKKEVSLQPWRLR